MGVKVGNVLGEPTEGGVGKDGAVVEGFADEDGLALGKSVGLLLRLRVGFKDGKEVDGDVVGESDG